MNSSFLPDYLKYGSDPFYDKIIDSGSVTNKLGVVKEHYGLDKLCDDASPIVRAAVKKIGYIKPKITDSCSKYRAYRAFF